VIVGHEHIQENVRIYGADYRPRTLSINSSTDEKPRVARLLLQEPFQFTRFSFFGFLILLGIVTGARSRTFILSSMTHANRAPHFPWIYFAGSLSNCRLWSSEQKP
jgi:hypothetical protein